MGMASPSPEVSASLLADIDEWVLMGIAENRVLERQLVIVAGIDRILKAIRHAPTTECLWTALAPIVRQVDARLAEMPIPMPTPAGGFEATRAAREAPRTAPY